MLKRKGLTILCSLLLTTASFAQSLGELATKEKERRQKTKGPVRVIDAESLKQGRREPASENKATTDAPEPAVSAPTIAPTLSSGSAGESLSQVHARRQECANELRAAEEDKKRQQALFDHGVAQVAVIDTTRTGPKPEGTPIGTPDRQVGRDRYGVPIMVPAVSPPAKVNVEGARVSCAQALSASATYPHEASKCAELQKKISAADERIKNALHCVRSR